MGHTRRGRAPRDVRRRPEANSGGAQGGGGHSTCRGGDAWPPARGHVQGLGLGSASPRARVLLVHAHGGSKGQSADSLCGLDALLPRPHADTRCHSHCVCRPQALYGVPVDAQALSRAGRPLADSALLGPRDATLQLALRVRGACTCRRPNHRRAACLLAVRSAALLGRPHCVVAAPPAASGLHFTLHPPLYVRWHDDQGEDAHRQGD